MRFKVSIIYQKSISHVHKSMEPVGVVQFVFEQGKQEAGQLQPKEIRYRCYQWVWGFKGYTGSTAISIHLSGKFPFRLTIINRKPAAAVT